jgi:hypothetical protein
MQSAHFGGDAGDRPAPEPPRWARVGHDPVAELDRLCSRRHPPNCCGGVEVVAKKSGVGALPASPSVTHGNGVGDEHMIMDLGIPGPGRGVARCGPDEPAGCHSGLCPATPAAALHDEVVQVGEGGVALGIGDLVHVLGPADHPQLGH